MYLRVFSHGRVSLLLLIASVLASLDHRPVSRLAPARLRPHCVGSSLSYASARPSRSSPSYVSAPPPPSLSYRIRSSRSEGKPSNSVCAVQPTTFCGSCSTAAAPGHPSLFMVYGVSMERGLGFTWSGFFAQNPKPRTPPDACWRAARGSTFFLRVLHVRRLPLPTL